MHIRDYLERIRFGERPAANVDSLAALMRAHSCSIPFENVDVQLGRRLTTSIEDAYDKIVERRRGGWCYEQNGLFGWALGELGFEVTRMSAAVRRDERGDEALDNHLVLRASCPRDTSDYLVDVGFGGSHFGPLPLEPHGARHEPFELQLRRLPEGDWRFIETFHDAKTSYDFVNAPADEAALSKKCASLQEDPDSTFVLNLVAQRRGPDTHVSLRGRVLSRKSAAGETTTLIASADHLSSTLRSVFDLDIPRARELWPRVVARHEALFGIGKRILQASRADRQDHS